MTHIGVERFCAGDGEGDGAQRQEGDEAIFLHEAHGMVRRERGQHAGIVDELADAEHEQDNEPEQCDWPEPAADAGGAEALDGEQPAQHTERDGQYQGLESGCGDVQPFDRAQHRDRGRQQTVAIEQGRACDAEQ